MENDILKIIINMLYKEKLEELYNTKSEEIDFPLKIKVIPNAKVICDFNKKYFKKYEYILLVNALVFALENNEEKFLDFLLDGIEDIKTAIDNDVVFRMKITEFAIKNISGKIAKNTNKIKDISFHNEMNLSTINNYKDLFNKINNAYNEFFTITKLYRKYLFDFINSNKDIFDAEEFLDQFLSTNRFDEEFILFTNNEINKDNIIMYKYILIKMILGDNYLTTEVYFHENEVDSLIAIVYQNGNKSKEEDIEELEYATLCRDILAHINTCLEEDNVYLPEDKDLRLAMYSNFFVYNSNVYDKDYDISVIESDNEKKLNLKKINPLYKLDVSIN